MQYCSFPHHHKEGNAQMNWSFQTVVLEKTLESPLDSKEIKPVNLKGNQPWISLEERMGSSNTLATWCKQPTHWKRPWYWESLKAVFWKKAEDKLVGWHHWLNGHELGWTLGDSERQGGLSCYRPFCDWTTVILSKYFIYATKYISHYQQK